MKIFESITGIKQYLKQQRENGASIGFVPTMGALHKGHISLIRKAREENDVVVCSTFVNPIQFNNKEDLAKYPRTVEEDVKMLMVNQCDVLFMPETSEMYPEPDNTIFDLGHLDKILEGKFRPGHFNGVAVVVKKLFEIVEPARSYFGEKDYQQLAIIKLLVKKISFPVDIISCPTVREPDGLAMSSRNLRLNDHERAVAPQIYRILQLVKEKAKGGRPSDMKSLAESEFSKFSEFDLEYFEIVNPETLLAVDNPLKGERCRALVAVYLGNIRLIDNIKIIF